MPAAAAAGDRLQHHRVADLRRHRGDLGVGRVSGQGRFGAGHDRRPGADRGLARPGLAAHDPDRLGRRADERQAGLDAGLGERGVLGQEAIAGMHGIGAGAAGDVDQLGDVEIALRRRVAGERPRLAGGGDMRRLPIARGVDADAGQAEIAAGAGHPHRDLAAVGDQDLLHGVGRSRPVTTGCCRACAAGCDRASSPGGPARRSAAGRVVRGSITSST